MCAYGQRYCNPETVRWLSRDPLGEDAGIDLYAYVRNNPTGQTDRLGLYEGWDDAIFAGVGGISGVIGHYLGNHASGKCDGSYWAAFLGGAAAGESLLYSGNPVLAGALGAAVESTVNGDDIGKAAQNVVVEGAVGLVPGFSAGSMSSITKQMVTKAANGTISRISASTAGKMIVAETADQLPGAVLGAGSSIAADGGSDNPANGNGSKCGCK
jgi:type VI secretion system secreted protein VgrG